jgi:hypothetical protein
MKNITKFVGLDVSKDTIAVGVADAGRDASRFFGTIVNTPEAVRKLVKQLEKDVTWKYVTKLALQDMDCIVS